MAERVDEGGVLLLLRSSTPPLLLDSCRTACQPAHEGGLGLPTLPSTTPSSTLSSSQIFLHKRCTSVTIASTGSCKKHECSDNDSDIVDEQGRELLAYASSSSASTSSGQCVTAKAQLPKKGNSIKRKSRGYRRSRIVGSGEVAAVLTAPDGFWLRAAANDSRRNIWGTCSDSPYHASTSTAGARAKPAAGPVMYTGASNGYGGSGFGSGGAGGSGLGSDADFRVSPFAGGAGGDDGVPNGRSGGAEDARGGGGGGGGGDGGANDVASKEKARKANPLVDLIETETAYVAELGMIIKKVASAWSKSNFPPAELDTMFRNVEAVYRINRSFLKSLKEIGPNPSSPKALGDLLMRWVDDLDAPYSRYCDNFFSDFDNWAAVQSNNKLNVLLDEISLPPANGSMPVYSDKRRVQEDGWTLDGLFALPQIRLKYYKKLYARLLKSTQPGRSDHKLLVAANGKLDELLEKSKRSVVVSILHDPFVQTSSEARVSQSSLSADTSLTGTADVSGDRNGSATSHSMTMSEPQSPFKPPPANMPQVWEKMPAPINTNTGSRAPSPYSAPVNNSNQGSEAPRLPDSIRSTSPLTISLSSVSSISMDSAAEQAMRLQTQLDTSRTLDIFTMTPKACQLQIVRPDLPFKRELRRDADVVIHFTPRATGKEMVVRRAHIFLLTDLFLVSERMMPSEKASRPGPAEFWLLFPPLAAKHLKITDEGGPGNVLSVLVMKKEMLILHFDSAASKEQWITAFDACQQFANSMAPPAKKQASVPAPAPMLQSPARSDFSGGLPSPNLPPFSPLVTSSTMSHSSSVMSPTTAVTPTNGLDGRTASVVSADSARGSAGATLTREGSFNSVASFPKAPAPGAGASPVNGPMMMMGGGQGAPLPPRPGQFHMQSPQGFSPGYRPGFQNGPPPGGRPPSDGSPTNSVQFMGGRPPFRPPGANGSPPYGPVRPGQLMQNGTSSPYGPVWPGQMNNRPPSGPGGIGFPPQNQGRGSPGNQQQGLHPTTGPGPRGQPNMRSPSVPDLRGQRQRDMPNGRPMQPRARSASQEGPQGPPKLPSQMMKDGSANQEEKYSPPPSPKLQRQQPQTSTVSAQMRCKTFLKQNHAQWKSLGHARLKLYDLMPSCDKQLVVENDKKTLISTIVMPDGVERVGKVGVAVELSDRGARTGIIYMLQLRSEESAVGLFGQLLEGSDRTAAAYTSTNQTS
ncbi:hypothetical protein K437DRAFT_54478 [Tilletiaria anomala UBC 951]|uniref:DH domain-containing protein n=1 Tax=Tilletiaria anomala (strain ATCC 24038 / CBS 436.72 / UBC 951) TaxID=1037660 RepID=A0A066VD12_TILAU|nr:uncharacterized protein K437DRAFT_54478 [Tilletiaria anomala UBC 951]KDN36460.1 hypothetical protein K437DRAFT_54478 [Tilletiaria anomala UBC 951]